MNINIFNIKFIYTFDLSKFLTTLKPVGKVLQDGYKLNLNLLESNDLCIHQLPPFNTFSDILLSL